jgi:hypothetical protein
MKDSVHFEDLIIALRIQFEHHAGRYPLHVVPGKKRSWPGKGTFYILLGQAEMYATCSNVVMSRCKPRATRLASVDDTSPVIRPLKRKHVMTSTLDCSITTSILREYPLRHVRERSMDPNNWNLLTLFHCSLRWRHNSRASEDDDAQE